MPGISLENQDRLLRLLQSLKEMGEGSRLEVIGMRTGDEMTLKAARQRIESGMQQAKEVTDEVEELRNSGQL